MTYIFLSYFNVLKLYKIALDMLTGEVHTYQPQKPMKYDIALDQRVDYSRYIFSVDNLILVPSCDWHKERDPS